MKVTKNNVEVGDQVVLWGQTYPFLDLAWRVAPSSPLWKKVVFTVTEVTEAEFFVLLTGDFAGATWATATIRNGAKVTNIPYNSSIELKKKKKRCTFCHR